MKQWHPIFAKLLRPLLEGYYEVLTNVSVGDVPREADMVLLRRSSGRPVPFHGLWSQLTPWNVLEYKGPTVSARMDDLDLLIEVGLGIHRRLNERRRKRKLQPLGPAKVSFWYLANRIGRRLLSDASKRLSNLQEWMTGAWCGESLCRKVYLVSGHHIPVGIDTLPLHVLAVEPAQQQLETARLISSTPLLWSLYGACFAALHPHLKQELYDMARSTKKEPKFHPEVLVELMGMPETIRSLGGVEKILDDLDPKEKRKALAKLIGNLTLEEREELRRQLK